MLSFAGSTFLIMKMEFYILLIGRIIVNTKQNELLSAHQCVTHLHQANYGTIHQEHV